MHASWELEGNDSVLPSPVAVQDSIERIEKLVWMENYVTFEVGASFIRIVVWFWRRQQGKEYFLVMEIFRNLIHKQTH